MSSKYIQHATTNDDIQLCRRITSFFAKDMEPPVLLQQDLTNEHQPWTYIVQEYPCGTSIGSSISTLNKNQATPAQPNFSKTFVTATSPSYIDNGNFK
jgi:muramoyltetrapeptide carboxypeptidase LdcA involved in peptidoglycan recycling